MSEKGERVKAAIDELLASLKDFFPVEVYPQFEAMLTPLKIAIDSVSPEEMPEEHLNRTGDTDDNA